MRLDAKRASISRGAWPGCQSRFREVWCLTDDVGASRGEGEVPSKRSHSEGIKGDKALRGEVRAECRAPVMKQGRDLRLLYSARGHAWHYLYILDRVEEKSNVGALVLSLCLIRVGRGATAAVFPPRRLQSC